MSPIAVARGIFAGRWPLNDQTVWTIVNRNEYDVDGQEMEVPTIPGLGATSNLYHGSELKVQRDPTGRSVLCFPMEAHGYGAILAIKTEPDVALQKLMSEMKQPHGTTLASYLTNG